MTIRIGKMTTVISLMYLLKMMKETIRSDINSFYCKIFWRRKVETFFWLIFSFIVILKRIFDRHALLHAYVSMKELFFTQKFFHTKNLSLGHPRKYVYAKSKKISLAKICPRENWFPKGSSDRRVSKWEKKCFPRTKNQFPLARIRLFFKNLISRFQLAEKNI